MTLKFNLTYRQVPRSSVGRASDRTMLRSVVRVQSLARGTCHFVFFFLQHLFHRIFLLTNDKPLMSFFFDTHIIYHQIDYTSFFFLLSFFFWHKLSIFVDIHIKCHQINLVLFLKMSN